MSGIVFATSFDHYTAPTARFNAVFTSNTAGGSWAISGVGRNGTNGATITIGGNTNNLAYLSKTLPSTLATFYHAFAFKISAPPFTTSGFGGRIEIASGRDNGATQLALYLHENMLLGVYNSAGTLLGSTSSIALLTGVWYHVEWKGTINNSTGVIEVRVNNVAVIGPTSSLDTQNTANAYVTELAVSCTARNTSGNTNPGFTVTFDDVVVRDDQFNGDQQVRCFLPTGIGSTDQWTQNTGSTTYEAVDETPPDSDTTYISEDTNGEESLFTFDSMPSDATITAVIPIPYAKKTDAGTATFKSVVRSNGTSYPGAEKAPSDSAYEFHPDVLMVNPDTSSPFSVSEWNEPIEIGPRRIS